MSGILVATTLEGGAVPDAVCELAMMGRSLDASSGISLLLAGADAGAAAASATEWFDEVILLDDESLEVPDGERFADLVAPVVEREQPAVLLVAHTNFAMDAAPRLSVMLDRPLITDCLSVERSGDTLSCVRTMYAGKLHAHVDASLKPNGCVLTVRPGTQELPESPPRVGGHVRSEAVPADVRRRRRYVRTVAPDAEDVDISQAEVLVAVGRGIDDAENMEIIEQLADALGAEIACSRPVVDNNWLPKTRQVGTSGVTVRPRIYLAIGISGSFQHMGGVKGSPFIVAINSDPRAPIFTDADVGIVGDLFDVVPALTEKIRAARS